MQPWLRIFLFAFVGIVLAFLVLPTLAVVPASFNNASYIRLPPEAVSLRWYSAFFRDPEWLSSFFISIRVAVIATTLALLLGSAAALGLERLPAYLRNALFGLFIAPLIVPTIVTAIALYYVARPLGLVHMFWPSARPYAAVSTLCRNKCRRFVEVTRFKSVAGRRKELGASPLRVFRTVTFPAALPGLVGAAVFAVITSFDEVILSVFLSGIHAKTMPVKMWETVRIEFTPVTAVAATFLIALAVILFAVAQLVRRPSDIAAK